MLVRRASQRGFTLIELMTAVSILVILSMAAAPSFREFIANQRVRNASFELMTALTLARSQAITQNASVSLKLKPGSSAWNQGWVVTDGTSTFSSQEAMGSLNITNDGNVTSITYGRDGRIDTSVSATQFTIDSSVAMNGVTKRCISVGLSGKPSSANCPASTS